MPPATFTSPTLGQPSWAWDAPPPPRAMKKCQMKARSVRGSTPVMANRSLREKPAFTAWGTAGARALNTASTISSAQWLVLMHTGAGGLAVDYQAPGSRDGDGAHGALVLGDVGRGHVHDRGVGQGAGVGVGAVDEPGNLRGGLAQVDVHGGAVYGYGGAYRDHLGIEAVVVDERLALVHAVGPLGDELAHLPLGGVEYVRDDALERARFVDSQQLADAAGCDVDRPDLRVQVAQEVLGVAHVGREHLEEVAARLPTIVDAQGRDAQALVVDFAGGRVVAPVGRAADIAVVRPVDGVEEQLAVVEDGSNDGYVRQVAAAEVGVIEGEEVTRRNVVAEVVAHCRARYGQRADVHGDTFALRDELAVGVQDRGREVAAGVENLGHGGS